MDIQFPHDLTEEEEGLGYQLQLIEGAPGQPAATTRTVRAVVYQRDPAERILKVYLPSAGRIEYQRQIHGVWEPTVNGDVPTWKLAGCHRDPADALAAEGRRRALAGLKSRIVSSPAPLERQHGPGS